MLLVSALGMAIVMMLMGMAQNIWQFLLLRALLGLLGGFIPNANALIAAQMLCRHEKSGWALGTLSTGAVSGALLGPLAGGFLADRWGLRTVFFMTAAVLFICLLLPCFNPRKFCADRQEKRCSCQRGVLLPAAFPNWYQPVCDLADDPGGHRFHCADPDALCTRSRGQRVVDVAFIAMIASVPGVAADERPAAGQTGRSHRAKNR